MYSTVQIANILEVNERTVRYYISQGHLKATLDGGNYVISIKDLTDFENDYFDTKRRLEQSITEKILEKADKVSMGIPPEYVYVD